MSEYPFSFVFFSMDTTSSGKKGLVISGMIRAMVSVFFLARPRAISFGR
ncbi:Uncharacterised protein [Mycobacteroides abscessus subsp. abscessus]|nr:Uncharacterised protein [Mycobacteroides abscessus subsp. abscessus]